MLASWEKRYDKPRQCIKKQRHHFANKVPYSQSYDFSSSHVWMWELDYKESWVSKNWCFWTVVLEKILRVSWTARRSNQSILKEISPEYSLEGCWSWNSNTLATWCKNWLIWKDPDAEKDWRQEGKDRGWDGWMPSLTQWTWVWVNAWSKWWTEWPDVLRFMGSQRVGHDWATQLNWTEPTDARSRWMDCQG